MSGNFRLARPRARGIGIPFDGSPGTLNAITDVAGIEVGHVTIISPDTGLHAARTGVTAVFPRGAEHTDPVFAAVAALNGSGEMTGSLFVNEGGLLEGPIGLTNSFGIGAVREAISVAMARKITGEKLCSLPLVAETFDGYLNDIFGAHITVDDATRALDTASSGPVEEGNVGGGTGVILFGYKGGIGTASRNVSGEDGAYTVGVLVQGNFGRRAHLRIGGLPAARYFPTNLDPQLDRDQGSIIVVAATDAPLLPHQLVRVAKRTALGLARTGSIMADTSGDIAVAFSTANPGLVGVTVSSEKQIANASVTRVEMLPNARLNPVFEATIEATEEAIMNALVAAQPMVGRSGHFVDAIDHEAIRGFLAQHRIVGC